MLLLSLLFSLSTAAWTPPLSIPLPTTLRRHENTMGPSMPRAFTSTIEQVTYMDGKRQPAPGGAPEQYESNWAYDLPNSRSRAARYGRSNFAPEAYAGKPQEWFNFTVWQTNNQYLLDLNGACLAPPQNAPPTPFTDQFSWLKYAQPSGSCGTGCTRYSLSHSATGPSDPYTISYLLEMGAHQPLYYEQNITCYAQGACQGFKVNYTQSTKFHSDFKPGVDSSIFAEFNETACTNPPVCPTRAPVHTENVTMWIFHPPNNFNISGQDLGDATGDVFFMCEDLLQGQPTSQDHGYGYVTAWQIELLPRWGQYQNCNGYPSHCLGRNDALVGREAALNLGYPQAGQCTDNHLSGVWYSLPVGGECPPGGSPGDGSCSWRVNHRIKTIDSTCMTQGQKWLSVLKVACANDKRAPFATAEQIFMAAFEEDKNATGWCPGVSP